MRSSLKSHDQTSICSRECKHYAPRYQKSFSCAFLLNISQQHSLQIYFHNTLNRRDFLSFSEEVQCFEQGSDKLKTDSFLLIPFGKKISSRLPCFLDFLLCKLNSTQESCTIIKLTADFNQCMMVLHLCLDSSITQDAA